MDPLVIQSSSLELVTLHRIADEDLVSCCNCCFKNFSLSRSVDRIKYEFHFVLFLVISGAA